MLRGLFVLVQSPIESHQAVCSRRQWKLVLGSGKIGSGKLEENRWNEDDIGIAGRVNHVSQKMYDQVSQKDQFMTIHIIVMNCEWRIQSHYSQQTQTSILVFWTMII